MITPTSPVVHAGSVRRNLLAMALASLALAACSASTQTASNRDKLPAQAAAIAKANAPVDEHTNPWASNCYAHFERDVLKLAGERAVNCGLLRLDATEAQKAEVEKCAKT